MAIRYGQQITFSAFLLQDILDPSHKLVKLAQIIDWEAIYEGLSSYYSLYGRQGLAIRLMVGLHILKHLENMSDEQCTQRLRGDLYWMYFCGVDPEALEKDKRYSHLDSSSMTKFRERIGDKGFSYVEQVIAKYLLEAGLIKLKQMTTDSFCLKKFITYPTDSGLLDKGRRNLLKNMAKLGALGIKPIKGLRTFARKARKTVLLMTKLGKDRAERIKEGTLDLAKMAKHVLNKSTTLISKATKSLSKLNKQSRRKAQRIVPKLKRQQKLVKKVIHQATQRYKGDHVAGKIYSLHEPQVICIRKNKKACPNEYGSKVNLSIDKRGFIVSHESYSTSKADAPILEPALKNWEKTTGQLPYQLNADRGYCQDKDTKGRIRKVKKISIPNKGKKPNPNSKSSWFKKGQRLRSQVEGAIGHLKNDHRLDTSRYRYFRGDKIGLSLGSIAWNLKKLITVS